MPYYAQVPEKVLNYQSRVWVDTKPGRDGLGCLSYSSVSDIVFHVRSFLSDILAALDLSLEFSAEITINHIRPDLSVLLMDRFLVGVVEVKKPGNNVLLERTVLGELLDQMFLVEGFYGTGPVIGILTTGDEWVVSWFPGDTDTLASRGQSEASYSTPLKPTSTVSTESKSQRDTIHQAAPHHSNLAQLTK